MDHPGERKGLELRYTSEDRGPKQGGDCKAQVLVPDKEETGTLSEGSENICVPLTHRTHRGAGTGPDSRTCGGESVKNPEAESG